MTLTSAELTLTRNVDYHRADGRGAVTVQRSASAGAFRVFSVNSGVVASLSNLTISGGNGSSSGGGIYNGSGMVTLTNSTVSGNSSSNGGGGICNIGGTVTPDKQHRERQHRHFRRRYPQQQQRHTERDETRSSRQHE